MEGLGAPNLLAALFAKKPVQSVEIPKDGPAESGNKDDLLIKSNTEKVSEKASENHKAIKKIKSLEVSQSIRRQESYVRSKEGSLKRS